MLTEVVFLGMPQSFNGEPERSCRRLNSKTLHTELVCPGILALWLNDKTVLCLKACS